MPESLEVNLYKNVRYQARLEIAMKEFLEAGGFGAFTTTFEDLHGLAQLPGLASQRLMAAGYGFGAEGDWKHSALVRAVKVMGAGITRGMFFYGRLYIPSQSGWNESAGCPYA